ncbi:MAG TPA: vWA domain-containing protein [Lautropia sp.]|nr:vWA domain-containing protein [Lautropia sp.]
MGAMTLGPQVLGSLRLLLPAVVVAATGYAAWYREPPPPSLAGVGVLMVFDITQSMLVEDVQVGGKATSRLELAKRGAVQVLEALPCGVSVGAGVFAAHRTVLLYSPVEVCANRTELVQSVGLVDVNMAWSGNSEVAKAYHASLLVARALPTRPAVVFLTDGHEAPPVSPRHRPSFQGKAGEVRAMVVGVGGLLPVPIPKRDPTGRALGYWNADEVMQIDPFQTPRTAGSADRLVESEGPAGDLRAAGTPGTEHLSSLRADYLQLLASETGASYRPLAVEAELLPVVNELLSLSLEGLPLPSRRLAMFIALAAATGFYCLSFLLRRR